MAQREQSDWRKFVMEANSTAGPAGFPPAPLVATVAPAELPGAVHAQPQFDPVDRLARVPAAADKMRLLAQRSDDHHAIIPEFETVREASMAKIAAANALKRLTDHPQDGGFGLKDDDRRVIVATKDLEKATADFKRLQELQEVRTAAWRTVSQAKAACEDFLRHGVPGNCTIEAAVEVEPPKLLKGETVLDAIERHRRRGRELKADLHRIASAPYPSSYAKAKMREQVERLAQIGTPDCSMLIEHDKDVAWATQRVTSEVHAERRLLAFSETADAVALVAGCIVTR
jgi:hypothetical protein